MKCLLQKSKENARGIPIEGLMRGKLSSKREIKLFTSSTRELLMKLKNYCSKILNLNHNHKLPLSSNSSIFELNLNFSLKLFPTRLFSVCFLDIPSQFPS